jgi:hypothetical protein
MNDDDLTHDLTRELHDRAGAVHGGGLALADVTGRARSIRRRRATTAVVGAAAAVALIVPTAALAGHHGGHRTEPMPATQSPTPSPTPSPSEPTDTAPPAGHQPPPGVLDVSDLPTGAAPRIDYVTGGNVRHGIALDTSDIATRYPMVGFVPMYDGSTVWQTSHGGTPYVEIEDASGTMQAPVESGWGLATNVAHTSAAWVDPQGQVRVWSAGRQQVWALGDPVTAGSDLRVSTVSDSCGHVGCTVDVNVADAPTPSGRQPWEVTTTGSQPLLDGSFLTVAGQSTAGLTIGLSKGTDAGSCSKLLGGGEFAGWSTCRHTLESFSPDGQLVLADPAYHDGLGNGLIAMHRAGTGRVTFERRSTARTQAFFPEAQWEDDTHVLAPVYQDGAWALVRFGSDGTMEYAVPPTAGDATSDPYVLPTGGVLAGD